MSFSIKINVIYAKSGNNTFKHGISNNINNIDSFDKKYHLSYPFTKIKYMITYNIDQTLHQYRNIRIFIVNSV